MSKISVVIITYNEEKRIGNTLDSVKFADEIILVDSFSSDRTVEIARQYTDRIFLKKFEDFSSQKNFGIQQASHPWVLVVDADEVITKKLQESILWATAAEHPVQTAYNIKRINFFMGKQVRYSGLQNDHVLRLFPSGICYDLKRKVHEVPVTKNLPIKKLDGEIMHYTFCDVDQMFVKVLQYSGLKALELEERGYRPTLLKMIFKPAYRFFNHYILRGGFLDGKAGLFIAINNSLEVYLRLIKIWRLRHGDVISYKRQIFDPETEQKTQQI